MWGFTSEILQHCLTSFFKVFLSFKVSETWFLQYTMDRDPPGLLARLQPNDGTNIRAWNFIPIWNPSKPVIKKKKSTMPTNNLNF